MECQSPKTIWPHRSIEWCDKNEEFPVTVPCGKCVACLVNKRGDWIFRLQMEMKFSKRKALFVTLTYDQKHCPEKLDKRHLQLFLKRLRKHYPAGQIRYYAVGEYGSKMGRPHYHLILFGAQELFVRKYWLVS